MIQELLTKEEGKTLEFKQDTSSLAGIAKTVVAFANTSGGTIVIGVEDKTKKIFGLTDPLADELRIINAISDSVTPFFRPNIEIQSYRGKPFILIQVPYSLGPYYLKKDGKEIAYIRFGSSNRIADDESLVTIKFLAKNITFDEMPCAQAPKDGIDWQGAESCFLAAGKELTKNKAKSIGLFSMHSGSEHPSNGGVLLFGKNRASIFPDAKIRCVRFSGINRGNTLDHRDIDRHLPVAVDEVLSFITKNTFTKTKIGAKKREPIPQYPPVALREAIINAIVHTDYAIKGSSIIIAIFDDRIEITNPGALPYGLSLADAIAGSSRSRNRVITRAFHHLDLVEQWGSGLQKIIHSCVRSGLESPKFEEVGPQFRVTLYGEAAKEIVIEEWQKQFMQHLQSVGEVSTQEAAEFWEVDIRTARRRLKKLVDEGLIAKIGVSKNDPYSKYRKVV